MSESVNKLNFEQVALQWLVELGYSLQNSSIIEREDFSDIVLIHRMRSALRIINPTIHIEVIETVINNILRTESPNLLEDNYRFHTLLIQGVDAEYRKADGKIAIEKVWLVDFDKPDNNDWLVVNQFPIIEDNAHSCFNIIVFLNGLPIGFIELQKSIEKDFTAKKAFDQLQLHIQEFPSIFAYNEILVVSDGLKAQLGTITSDWKGFMPWKAIDEEATLPYSSLELETLVKDVFEKRHFLDLLKYFIVFEVDNLNIYKNIAKYYQINAVNKAVASTIQASSPEGDRRAGIIWHIQGSGKSLTMAFYAGKIIQHPAMTNPTLLILTDRKDLENQLFATFISFQNLLRQQPMMVNSRSDLQKLLTVASGGIIFSTVQMFLPDLGETLPVLSSRRNIVIIVEEIHRGHHTSSAYTHQISKSLPNASFIGFTSIPIEVANRGITEIFGDYVDVYDIQRAIDDNVIVPVYYEDRSAKSRIKVGEESDINWELEEIVEEEEFGQWGKHKNRWSNLEAIVGAQQRIALIAKDLVEHFERRLATLEGKAIVICISRKVCLELYQAITQLRPQWHNVDDEQGVIKVVMTGSALDPEDWQLHIRNAARRALLARQFKDPNNSIKIVIVRDMWLTGFDAPCVHTIYLDAPLRGQNLIQAISRVNRVFRDKPNGLVVDYLGLTSQIETVLKEYIERDHDQTIVPFDEVISVIMEKYEVVSSMLSGFDHTEYNRRTPVERLSLIPSILEHILNQDNGKIRFINAFRDLYRFLDIVESDKQALIIKDDIKYFQFLQSLLLNLIFQEEKDSLDIEYSKNVSGVTISAEENDIYTIVDFKKLNTSNLSNELLEEVQRLPQQHLAFELLRKLIEDNIKASFHKNVVQSRTFTGTLEHIIEQYRNLTIGSAQAISFLINIAKELRKAQNRGRELSLTEEQLAFYDILLNVDNKNMKIISNERRKKIASDLVEIFYRNAVLDWTLKESAQAKFRVQVKHLLRQHQYPFDKQKKVIDAIIEQADLLSDNG